MCCVRVVRVVCHFLISLVVRGYRVAVKNTSSDSITALLSQYLLGLVQNFIYLSLVQKFFSQVIS